MGSSSSDDDPSDTDSLCTQLYAQIPPSLLDLLYPASLTVVSRAALVGDVSALRERIALAERDDELARRTDGVMTDNVSRMNTPDNRGWLPIHFAAQNGHDECVAELVDYYLRDSVKDSLDQDRFKSKRLKLPLDGNGHLWSHFMKYKGTYSSKVSTYLSEKLVQKTFNGQTALSLALRNSIRNQSVIKRLLDVFQLLWSKTGLPEGFVEEVSVCAEGTYKNVTVVKWIFRLVRQISGNNYSEEELRVLFYKKLFQPSALYDEFGQKVGREMGVLFTEQLMGIFEYILKPDPYTRYSERDGNFASILLSARKLNCSNLQRDRFVQGILRHPKAQMGLCGDPYLKDSSASKSPELCHVGSVLLYLPKPQHFPVVSKGDSWYPSLLIPMMRELYNNCEVPISERKFSHEEGISRLKHPGALLSKLELFECLVKANVLPYMTHISDICEATTRMTSQMDVFLAALKTGFIVPELSPFCGVACEFGAFRASPSDMAFLNLIRIYLLGIHSQPHQTALPYQVLLFEEFKDAIGGNQVPSLLSLCRSRTRRLMHQTLGFNCVVPDLVERLQLPASLQRYLLFDDVTEKDVRRIKEAVGDLDEPRHQSLEHLMRQDLYSTSRRNDAKATKMQDISRTLVRFIN